MKFNYVIAICLSISTMSLFSQEKSLFLNTEPLENIELKRNDSALYLQPLFKFDTKSKSALVIPDYLENERRNAFFKTENSATKNVMPVYKPKGLFKHRTLFPDNSVDHSLIVEPIKER